MNNSRLGNSLKNIFTSFLSQILTLLLGFFSRSVFLYCLNVDYLGIQGLFSDILNMLSLADLGFGTAMTYSMYKPLAENDKSKLSGLITFYKKIYRIIAISITIIGLSLIPFLKYLVKLNSEMPNLKLFYVLYLFNTVASYLVVYKTCILTADQKSYILTKYNMILSILQTIAMMIFLLITRNYIVYLCVQVIFTYIKNFYGSYVAEKMYPYIKNKVNLPKEEAKEILNNIKSVFLYKVSSVLINATDNTLISVLVGTAMVGYYSNYTLITTKLSGFVYTIFYSLTASLGNLVVTENKEKRFEIFKVMQSISVLLSTFCVTCVLFLQQDFIQVWLGEEYMLDNLIVYAMVLNFYFSISLLPIWVFREATGLYRKTKYVMLVTAAVNIVMSVLLGEMIGLAGILLATSIARILTYFWYEPKLLFKKYFNQSCLTYFVSLLKSFLVTAIVFFVVYNISQLVIVTGWLTLILKGIVVSMLTLLILFLAYRKSEGTKLLINKIKSRLIFK